MFLDGCHIVAAVHFYAVVPVCVVHESALPAMRRIFTSHTSSFCRVRLAATIVARESSFADDVLALQILGWLDVNV